MDIEKLKKEVRSTLISPCKRSGYRINSRALSSTWPKRKLHIDLFNAIEEAVPYPIDIKDKIHLILKHDAKNPLICFNCNLEKETVKKRKDDFYLCNECSEKKDRKRQRKQIWKNMVLNIK